MVRPKLIHEEVSKIHCFERDRYKEFEQLCKDEKISVSEGLRILIERELEKKAEGEDRTNPLNLPNITDTMYVLKPKKPSLTLDDFFTVPAVRQLIDKKGAKRIESIAFMFLKEVHRRETGNYPQHNPRVMFNRG